MRLSRRSVDSVIPRIQHDRIAAVTAVGSYRRAAAASPDRCVALFIAPKHRGTDARIDRTWRAEAGSRPYVAKN